ncbi:restriction endonuclease subunit S [Lactococcus lactis]|uniref:restriction endonuclease subunit S n=2 Tax=Lactococcus lactis TaxID=1358 RepID=UPI000BA7B35B|nr:restriction endonuclease subunit S [Lactococcus lactis]PEN17802.1 restriction endonuclease subunit S [Lactococcus lactis]
MMSKKSPQLRFEGFTDDWEERKLSDVANHRGGTAIEKYFDKDGVYKVISIGSYGLNSQYVDQNIRAISNEITDGRVVNSGELTMVLNDKTANGTIIGRTLLVEKDNEYVINQRTEIISPKENFDSNFAYTILNGPFREKVKRIVQGGTQIYVNYPAVSNLNLELPKIEEQQKIGSFFKQLDDTIALHQRKLDLLKEQKKGYLQKMFPKNGAKVPELRFAGFADDWEERKLKDVTERVRSNDGRMDLPTLTMSASSGWLDQKDRFSGDISGKEKKNYTLLKKGELSYNHGNSKLAKYGVVFSLTNYEEALVPRVYHSFKALENTSADFIEYMFSTKLPDRELGKLISSGARMDGLLNINYDDFMNIHISIPNYEEQILMSAFFRKLDENIALHQRKLDLLKEQKKGFLQKMFV